MTRRARGEGTVYQDGDTWIARIDLPIGPDGKRKQRKRRAPTKTKAIQKLKELQKETEHLDDPHGLRRTIEQSVQTYLDSQPKSSRSPKTIEMEQWRGQVVVKGLGRRQIGRLTVEECDAFLDRAAAGEYGSRPMKLETVRRVRRFLINTLRNEMRLSNVTRNVADLSILPDIANQNQNVSDDDDGDSSISIRRTLSYDDYRSLWNTARYPLKVIVDLCGRNGLRPSEARGLRWRCINFDDMTIKIDRQMSSTDILVPPKTKRSRRTIQIDQVTSDCLISWRDQQGGKKKRAGSKWLGKDLVVSTRYGTTINASNLRRMTEAACIDARIERIVPYELRHTAITFQIDAGNETWQVADWAGTSTRMVDDVYRHRLSVVSGISSVQVDGIRDS